MKKAFQIHKFAADQGDAREQHKVGDCYRLGVGLEQSLEKAIEYYTLASNQGYYDEDNLSDYCLHVQDLLKKSTPF